MSTITEDRELLKLAAKAVGYRLGVDWCSASDGVFVDGDDFRTGDHWNPLTDDGDALRLAVKLQIQITPGTYNKDEFTAFCPYVYGESREYWNPMQDECAATRRAIVRAAASIGEHLCEPEVGGNGNDQRRHTAGIHDHQAQPDSARASRLELPPYGSWSAAHAQVLRVREG